MTVIELKFIAGRFHATPWTNHVNEGVVEWPPSPWRLLRALVATWFLKARDDLGVDQVKNLIGHLASSQPHWRLPDSVHSHTRHYMPLAEATARTLILDAFYQLPPNAAVYVFWPTLELPSDALEALEILVRRLGYLGRAESLVEARVVATTPRGGQIARPVATVEGDSGGPSTPLLCPKTLASYASWRHVAEEQTQTKLLADKRAAAAKKGKDSTKVKLGKADRNRVADRLPNDLFAALQLDTSSLQSGGWTTPPGAEWVSYDLPADPARGLDQGTRRRGRRAALPTVARFSLASKVLPSITDALWVGAKTHKALMRQGGAELQVLRGTDATGHKLRGHQHAFILPEAHPRSGRLTHITVFAPLGLDQLALKRLRRLTKLHGKKGWSLELELTSVGQPDELGGAGWRTGRAPILAATDRWVSQTPFVPTRHPKAFRSGKPKLDEHGLQIGSPAHDLLRLLALNRPDLPRPKLHVLERCPVGRGKQTWRAFRRTRPDGGGLRGSSSGYGFELEFPEPVRGPLAFGYGAHFGLGLFIPREVCLGGGETP